jgi:hypothetical protein
MVYVSSQQAYYSERSFRLLESMGQKLVLDVDIVRNVLAAAASKDSVDNANEYLHHSLHGALEEKDFVVTDLRNKANDLPSHQGSLTLFPSGSVNTSYIRADYREPETTELDSSCATGTSAIVICATIDLSALVGPAFEELEEGFFQDVLIADSRGEVLYQRSGGGMSIHNLSTLFSTPPTDSTGKQGAAGLTGKERSGSSQSSSFSQVSQYSNLQSVKLADSTYQLFIEPVPVSLWVPGEGKRRLVLCGLRSIKHAEAQAMALPHTYLIWALIVILATFTLTWPFLKLAYMSPKERLHGRHLLYLFLSVTVATASVTLIALNTACKMTDDNSSEREIRQLAQQINANVANELRGALRTLDVLGDKSSGLLGLAQKIPSCGKPAQTDNRWNEAQFLQNHSALLKTIPNPIFDTFSSRTRKGVNG